MVRTHGDRILMMWEDDRGNLLREIESLKKANRKQERTKEFILQEFKLIKEQHAATMSRRVRKERDLLEMEALPSKKRSRDSVETEVGNGLPNAVTPVRSRAADAGKNILPAPKRSETVTANAPKDIPGSPLVEKLKGLIPENASAVSNVKVVGPLRKRSDREQLPGHTCLECARYIANLRTQGLLTTEEEEREMLKACSRHKSISGPPPDTPDGFWNLTVHTPEEWKHD